MIELCNLKALHFPFIFSWFHKRGAIAFPFLPEGLRLELLTAAKEGEYKWLERETYGGLVKQEIEAYGVFDSENILAKFSSEVSGFISEQLSIFTEYPFSTTCQPNEVVVQRYRKDSLGITPHVDGASHRNLVILIVLEGYGDFNLCDDRSGSNPYKVDMTPGCILFMRANGFLNYTNTPFHFLNNIKSKKYVLGIRQKAKKI